MSNYLILINKIHAWMSVGNRREYAIEAAKWLRANLTKNVWYALGFISMLILAYSLFS